MSALPVPRGAALLVTVVLAGSLAACGHSAAPASSGVAGVACTSYVLHGSGRFHDEVSVRVRVSNATARSRRFVVDVQLSVSHASPAAMTATETEIHGTVAARSSAELGRKVLTSGPVRQCRVTRVTRVSRS